MLKINNPYPLIDFSVHQYKLPKIVSLPIYDQKPLIKIGDKILTGQVISKGQTFVHSSISGEVIDISHQYIAHKSGLTVNCIIIKSDNQDNWVELIKNDNFLLSPPTKLIDQIATSGIIGLGGAGFSTAQKLKNLNNCHTIIINASECEVAVEADNALMINYPREVIKGIEILLHISKAKQVIIAIEDDKQEAFESLLLFNHNDKIKIQQIPTIYGSGSEKTLIKNLLDISIKSGKFASDYGVLMQNITTTKAISDFIIEGKPLIERIITLAGNKNINIRIGTIINDISEITTKKIRLNGLMMGIDLANKNYAILKTTSAIFTKQNNNPQPKECIRCGECVKVCPSNLLPQQIYWFTKNKNIEKAIDYNVLDCTKCRMCDEVCPSYIPLSGYFEFAQNQYFYSENEKKQAQISSQRFEYREYRLERNKKERAEMMARKREEIKKKLAEKSK